MIFLIRTFNLMEDRVLVNYIKIARNLHKNETLIGW